MEEPESPGPETVLIVDDSEANLELLRELVQSAGYRVITARDGVKALSLLEQVDVDTVLLDIQMPGISGLTVLEEIRKTHRRSVLPVIMVTALDESEKVVQALDAGANDYITKPIDIGVCAARVRNQVDLRRATLGLREATDELSRRNAVLERLNQEKNQFLGVAAHDLRNPIAIIQAYAEFLRRTWKKLEEEKIDRFLGEIQSSSDFMLRLIGDLLSVATIEAGHLQLELASVELGGIVRRNVELNRVLASSKQIGIDFEDTSDHAVASIDAVKIMQVLNNLLSNAVKFSHPGSRVEVTVTRVDESLELSVKDQGQGIPADELGKLFKPFQRTSVRSTTGEASTGLGLAIVRRIVEGHGGTIRVESEVGTGTTFTITLPIAPPEDERCWPG